MGENAPRLELTPVRQQRIYQVIIEQIIELIRQGKLRVGEKLPPERALAERALAEMLPVSRPSMREALRVMEVIGLIDRKPGGGSHITDLNIAHFLNMISPIFLKREGLGIELLEMRFLLEIRAAELAAKAAGKAYGGELDEHIERMRRAFSADDLEGHLAIYEAIRSGDPVKARKAMEEHMNRMQLVRPSIFLSSISDLTDSKDERNVAFGLSGGYSGIRADGPGRPARSRHRRYDRRPASHTQPLPGESS
ncbi:MAG TPA: GntR family transcriptional regulator [Spirochaetia bacterium]|nr:GntR family transcriptional regulator [Spirochaetia bacterium]